MFRRVSALLLLIGPLACNRADNAADRQAAEMRDAINKIQSDTDKIDQRLGMLEVAVAEDKQAAKDAAPAASTGVAKAQPAQPPRVLQIGDPAEPENEDPNAPDARPEIRLTGQPGAFRPARGKSRGDEGSITESQPRPSLDPDAKKAYEDGLALVQGKQYAKGNEQLAAFLAKWPDHPYAENAMYWRGEAFYAQGEYLRAAEQFEAVLQRFGAGKKGADALLKLGMCHDRLGDAARAQQYWDRLKNDFPRSDAAKRIPSNSKSDRSRPEKGPKESR